MDRDVINRKLESLRRGIARIERLAELRIISPRVATSLQKAVAFRNILVHNYTNINWDIVANILTSHLTDFVQFAQAIDRLNNDNDQKP